MSAKQGPSAAIGEALERLGVRNLLLGIQDANFPSEAADDTGRGTPCAPAGTALAAFLRRLGFDGLQLGPQGLTSAEDPSPYTGSLFSRDPLSISLARLADPHGEWHGLLPAARLAALVQARPDAARDRVPYAHVHRLHHAALNEAWQCFEKRLAAGEANARDLAARLQRFSHQAIAWLEPDALYEVLRAEYGGRDFGAWSGSHAQIDRALGDRLLVAGPLAARREALTRRHADALRLYRFTQLLAHAQHATFRDESARMGLRLFGDLQIGVSPRDEWRHPRCFLPGYRLGAPPSPTNPQGQAWHYPVLDPEAYFEAAGPGPVLRFLALRIDKAFAEYDAVRIDHPQGWVCPWVYREDDPDPLNAVQHGARLFSSPDLADHPGLARYAIATRADLTSDPDVPRHHDHWVVSLRADQIDRYATLMDRMVATARRTSPRRLALACEVLSTLPYPLACVLERHHLGRFAVTQKAKLDDPDDVYRADRAHAADWVMFGNHDTPPLWQLLPRWASEGGIAQRARHAARVLAPAPEQVEAFAAELGRRPDRLAHAEIAQLFVSPAENVMIHFSDLFGLDVSVNRPGTTGGDNWRVRLPQDWRTRYEEAVRAGRALDLRVALVMALRSRPGNEALADALEREA